MSKSKFKVSFYVLLLLTLAIIVLTFLNLEFIELNYIYFVTSISWIIFFFLYRKDVDDFIKQINKTQSHLVLSTIAIFNTLFITYLFLVLIKNFGMLKSLNLNLLLVFILIEAVVLSLSRQKMVKDKVGFLDQIMVIVVSIIVTIIVFAKTKEFSLLSYFISITSGLIVFVLGLFVYEDEERDEAAILLNKKVFIYLITSICILSLSLTPFFGIGVFRIVFGSIFVLFIPGFIISYCFFDNTILDFVERIVLSVALSISVIPLIVFYLSLAGMIINSASVLLVILLISLTALLYIAKKQKIYNFFRIRFKKHYTVSKK